MRKNRSFASLRVVMGRKGGLKRKILSVLIVLSTIAVCFIILTQSSQRYFKREIKFENLHYDLYNRDKGSFISEDTNNFLERIESKNRNVILKNLDLKDKLVWLNKYQNEIARLNPPEDQPTQTDNSAHIKYSEISTDKSSEMTTYKMMNIINKLSSKVDNIVTTLQQHEANYKKEQKAKVINPSDQKKCTNPRVLFLVTSHSSNVKRRETIRKNWGNQDKFNLLKKNFNLTYDVFFSVGLGSNYEDNEQIKQESRTYRDILIVDRDEDFYDLTRRVMASFEWAVTHCKKFTYLFKVDDDIFINIPNVMTFLTNNTMDENKLYAGDMNIEASVNRDPKSKYRVTYEEWQTETYPPYCSGGGFIISRDIVKSIVPYFDWVNPYKIDDVYIGMMIQRAKIKDVTYYIPEDNDMFWFYSNATSCNYRETSLVYHKVADDDCMTKLTFKSIIELPKAAKLINKIINKPPPTLEEFKNMVNLPKGFKSKNLKIDNDKMPSLNDIPKALSPIELKMKTAREYFARIRRNQGS